MSSASGPLHGGPGRERRWSLSYTLTKSVVWEGMLAAGKVHMTGVAFFWSAAHVALLVLFAPIGIILAGVVVLRLMGYQAELTASAYLPFFIFPLAIAGLWISRAPWIEVAGATARAKFNRRHEVEIDASGVRLKAPSSDWNTGWADVEAVVGTKRGLVVVVSGIALIVPRAAFESADESERALNAMTGWQAVAA